MRKLYHLFYTCGEYFVYDMPKNMILNIPKSAYMILNKKSDVNSACGNKTVNNLLSEGFFSNSPVQTILHPATNNLRQMLANSLHMLILQVTQNCNLRCKYCVYSGGYINRQHNNKRMSFETAQKAIDYYLSNSSQSSVLRFGFYGGEPTLEINLIKKCVEYVKRNSIGKEVEYHLTTNATMLNRKSLEFFVENNFYLTISLDGPKDIQDKNRVYADSGKGTFDKVIENILWVKDEYPDFVNNIHFNAVMDPADKYSLTNEFFSKDDRIKDFYVNVSEKNDINFKEVIEWNSEYYCNQHYEYFKAIHNYFRCIPDDVSPLVKGYLMSIKKNIADKLEPDKSELLTGHPGGPCIPGLQRLFVSADGKLYPCERVNENAEAMRIGDVEEGIDIKKVEYLLNVGRITENTCRYCWAFRFCTSCAVYAEDGDILSSEKRLARCMSIKKSIEDGFKTYCIFRKLNMDFEEFE